jgi:hypothetical protein
MRTSFLAVIAFFIISPIVTTASPDDQALAWVSYCKGDVQKASIVGAQKATRLSKGKSPFCVVYEEGSYDPNELRGQCESEGPRPKPWESSKDVNLVVTLPREAKSGEYEVVITVTAIEAPLGCAGCDVPATCEPETREIMKTFHLTFSGKERRKAWSMINAMQSAEGREFLRMKATAELKQKGTTVTERTINVEWPYCC